MCLGNKPSKKYLMTSSIRNLQPWITQRNRRLHHHHHYYWVTYQKSTKTMTCQKIQTSTSSTTTQDLCHLTIISHGNKNYYYKTYKHTFLIILHIVNLLHNVFDYTCTYLISLFYLIHNLASKLHWNYKATK
jgi:hypothetical protein